MRRHTRSESLSASDAPEQPKHVQLKLPHVMPGRGRRRRNFVMDYLIDYTSNSNLHGLKYIGEHERTFVEKVFWLFMFTCSVVLCAGLIQKVWNKWNESPVIVSFAETSTPVWQIPFPAITICFETKTLQTKFNFTENYHNRYNLSGEERELYEDVSMVCDSHLAATDGRMFANASVVVNIREVAPPSGSVFFGCKWKQIPKESCSELFSPILTEEGMCYTFNTLGADELYRKSNLHSDYSYLEHENTSEGWTLEEGYPESIPLETYPQRGAGYGAKAGLTILMKSHEEDLDYLCRGPVQGFKILLHNPAEVPRLSQQYFRAPLSQEVVVAVKPNMMTTSEGLRAYDPERRQCYFPTERYLRYFKVYTQMNCEVECLANFTYAVCGCVQFAMPHNESMPICAAGSVPCIERAQMQLVTHEISSGLGDEGGLDPKAKIVAAQCKCLAACTSIEYDAETSQADFDWKALFTSYKLNISEPDLRFSRVMIFFKEAQFITSRRSELYGQTDFLANCGGLLGLFMGFSLLSLAEIIYFLTLRLFCVILGRRSKKSPTPIPESAPAKNEKMLQ